MRFAIAEREMDPFGDSETGNFKEQQTSASAASLLRGDDEAAQQCHLLGPKRPFELRNSEQIPVSGGGRAVGEPVHSQRPEHGTGPFDVEQPGHSVVGVAQRLAFVVTQLGE